MEVLEKIRQVIDGSVRPYLQGHGGDIEILDFTEGVLRFRLTGMCSNCPSSLFTTEDIDKKRSDGSGCGGPGSQTGSRSQR